MLKKVVLPAPFGPIRLTIERSGIVKSTLGDGHEPAELLAHPDRFQQVCHHASDGST